MEKQAMSEIINYIERMHLKEIDEDDIYSLLTNILIYRNLLGKRLYVSFEEHDKNIMTSDALLYDKQNKKIIVDMNKLNSKRLQFSNDIYRELSYFQIVCVYEVLLGIEKYYIDNLDSNFDSKILRELMFALDIYKKITVSEEDKYFDINDADLKIFKQGYDPSRSIVDTLSPKDRYVKVKALFDTCQIFGCINNSIDNINLFLKDNMDLVINGYTRECNEIMYPVFNYFSSDGFKKGRKFLKHLSWYNKDYYKMLTEVSLKYDFDKRLIYGMPIDAPEYEKIRRLSKGENRFGNN